MYRGYGDCTQFIRRYYFINIMIQIQKQTYCGYLYISLEWRGEEGGRRPLVDREAQPSRLAIGKMDIFSVCEGGHAIYLHTVRNFYRLSSGVILLCIDQILRFNLSKLRTKFNDITANTQILKNTKDIINRFLKISA